MRSRRDPLCGVRCLLKEKNTLIVNWWQKQACLEVLSIAELKRWRTQMCQSPWGRSWSSLLIGRFMMRKEIIIHRRLITRSQNRFPIIRCFKIWILTQMIKERGSRNKERGFLWLSSLLCCQPEFYRKLGFMQADIYGIKWEIEVPAEAFMVRELRSGALKSIKGTLDIIPNLTSYRPNNLKVLM